MEKKRAKRKLLEIKAQEEEASKCAKIAQTENNIDWKKWARRLEEAYGKQEAGDWLREKASKYPGAKSSFDVDAGSGHFVLDSADTNEYGIKVAFDKEGRMFNCPPSVLRNGHSYLDDREVGWAGDARYPWSKLVEASNGDDGILLALLVVRFGTPYNAAYRWKLFLE